MKIINHTYKTLETYLGLCTDVYELSKPDAPSDAYSFYRDYAKAAKGPILEPMCGTGRFLLPLFEEGFDIQGFDASEHMLSALRDKAQTRHLEPNIWKGFAEGLNTSEKYNLIFIPAGSFCLMTDLQDVTTALKKFYTHLNDDGIFLFEAETSQAVPPLEVWRGSVWPKSKEEKILLSQLATRQGQIYTSLCKYELMRGNQIIHTEVEELKIKIYEQGQLVEMLKAAGFKHTRILKAFDPQKQPDAQDESVVYECKK